MRAIPALVIIISLWLYAFWLLLTDGRTRSPSLKILKKNLKQALTLKKLRRHAKDLTARTDNSIQYHTKKIISGTKKLVRDTKKTIKHTVKDAKGGIEGAMRGTEQMLKHSTKWARGGVKVVLRSESESKDIRHKDKDPQKGSRHDSEHKHEKYVDDKHWRHRKEERKIEKKLQKERIRAEKRRRELEDELAKINKLKESLQHVKVHNEEKHH